MNESLLNINNKMMKHLLQESEENAYNRFHIPEDADENEVNRIINDLARCISQGFEDQRHLGSSAYRQWRILEKHLKEYQELGYLSDYRITGIDNDRKYHVEIMPPLTKIDIKFALKL